MSPCSPYKNCSGFYTLFFFFFFFGWWIQRGDQFDINLLGVTSGKCYNEQRGNGRRGNWNKEGMLPWLKDKWNCSGCCGLHGCFRLCVRGVATGSAWGGLGSRVPSLWREKLLSFDFARLLGSIWLANSLCLTSAVRVGGHQECCCQLGRLSSFAACGSVSEFIDSLSAASISNGL